jgi:hypothetical protein
LFGKINSIHGNIIQNTKSLDVNVDDSISMLLKTDSGIVIQTLNNFIVRVHNHMIYVEGSKGRIEYNFVTQKIILLKHKSKLKTFDVSDDSNSRFINEIKYFIKSIKKNSIDTNFDLNSGLRFMKLASMVSKNKINLPL